MPRDLQLLARDSAREVLDKLATPLEIQKFFDAMRTQDRDGLKNPRTFVAEAIDRAHQSSIEQTVIDQIEKRDDVRAAAIVWALLTANDKVTRSVLREIEDGLADMDTAMEKGVSPLVDFFVAARNLRQSDGGIVSYYHPRVEAGIARTLERYRQTVRQTLSRLIDLLVADSGPGAEWGAGAAARMLARSRNLFGVKPSDGAAAKIDAWLEARLAEGGKEFEAYLELAALAGSSASNSAETARFLLHRPDKTFAAMSFWGRPDHSADWYLARANNPSTKPLVETFIRTILPQDRIHYPTSFSDELARLSSGLGAAFLDAARTAVHYGYIASDDAIAHGALSDIEGFEAIVDMAVDVLTPTEKDLRKAAETHLDIINDVYSEDYAQHLAENDDGYTASEFLKAYVGRVREEKGWQYIVQHPQVDRLRSHWLRALAEEAREGRLNGEEFGGAFQAGYGTQDEEAIWLALLNGWDPQYRQQLKTRFGEGAPNVDIERAALACLIEHESEAFSAILADLVEQGATNRLVEISRGIACLRSGYFRDGSKHIAAAEAAAVLLPQPFGEICSAEIAQRGKEPPNLSDEARGILAEIPNPSNQVRVLRLELDAGLTLPVEDDVRWALETSDDSSTAILAVEAAIRYGMTEEVEGALDHRFAHVVARALRAVATLIAEPLPEHLLAFATHRASPVRRALVDVLKTKPHPAHKETLIKLAGDKWTKSSMFYGNEADDYPIAQAAIAALVDLSPLGDKEEKTLFSIATDTSDPDVRDAIFRLLASSGIVMQNELFELAVEPGRERVRSSAAFALLQACDLIDQCVVDKITPKLVATRYEPVAGVLALLLGWRGAIPTVRAAAEELATNSKRRGLLLLTVWLLKDRNQLVAEEIAAMLPAGHKAASWALGGTLTEVDDTTIADLGDPAVCAEVLRYMKIGLNQ